MDEMGLSGENWVIEVEVQGVRGLEGDGEVDVSMEVLTCAGGAATNKKQWCSLGSVRKSSLIRQAGRDRFVFMAVCANPAVRFEVVLSGGKKGLLKRKGGQSIGTAEVTPWLGLEEGRWVRLTDKKKKKEKRRELRVVVTSKVGGSDDDVGLASDAMLEWFPRPYPPPRGRRLNCARVAVVRATGLPSSPCFVSARAIVTSQVRSGEYDAFSMMMASGQDPGRTVSKRLGTTSARSDGTWLQTLTLGLPKAWRPGDEVCVDVAVVRGKGEAAMLLGRAAAHASDEPYWINVGPGVSLRLAVRIDYDERLDDSEDRPFFDGELFKTTIQNDREASINAVAVAIARANELFVNKAVASVRVGSSTKSTSQKTSDDGLVVWNECLEFLGVNAASVVVEVAGHSIDVPVPKNVESRDWYEVGNGAVLLVVATRYCDATLFAENERAQAANYLSLAFPNVSRRDVERVYDSTRSLNQACVALGALAGAATNADDNDDLDLVAASNATDLRWAIDQAPEEEASTKLSPRKTGSIEDDDDAFQIKKAMLMANKPQLMRCSTAASHLSKKDTIALLKVQPLGTLHVHYVFREQAPALDYDGEEVPVQGELDRGVSINSKHEDEVPLRDDSIVSSLPTAGVSPQVRRKRRAFVTIRTWVNAHDVKRDDLIKAGWSKSHFELARLEIDVDRTPRDFVTLRQGLVGKTCDDHIPPLPKWVRRALNFKEKAQLASVAVGVATASLGAALAFATGVAPVLAIGGGLVAGAVAITGTHKTSKNAAKAKIDAELAQCVWVSDIVQYIMTQHDKNTDAVLFLKLFLAHGGKCRLLQKPKDSVSSQNGLLNMDALREANDADVPPPPPPEEDYAHPR